jgi:hypothetical protein
MRIDLSYTEMFIPTCQCIPESDGFILAPRSQNAAVRQRKHIEAQDSTLVAFPGRHVHACGRSARMQLVTRDVSENCREIMNNPYLDPSRSITETLPPHTLSHRQVHIHPGRNIMKYPVQKHDTAFGHWACALGLWLNFSFFPLAGACHVSLFETTN